MYLQLKKGGNEGREGGKEGGSTTKSGFTCNNLSPVHRYAVPRRDYTHVLKRYTLISSHFDGDPGWLTSTSILSNGLESNAQKTPYILLLRPFDEMDMTRGKVQ